MISLTDQPQTPQSRRKEEYKILEITTQQISPRKDRRLNLQKAIGDRLKYDSTAG
jgi:hypothetical protein